MAVWIIRLRLAAAHDPGMFGLTQRPRPPASALGLFICPQFERLPEHSGEVISIIAVFHCYQIKSPASTALKRGLCARDLPAGRQAGFEPASRFWRDHHLKVVRLPTCLPAGRFRQPGF